MKKCNSKKIVIIMLTCMIVLSSIWAGRTYAYFSAQSNAQGTITMGTLKIDNLRTTDGAEINWGITAVPNQEFGGSYKAIVDSDINYYSRVLLKASVTTLSDKTHSANCGDEVDDDIDILSIDMGDSYAKSSAERADGYVAYYKLNPTTPNTSGKTDEAFDIGLKIHDWVGNGGCDYYMGATITIKIRFEAIQADYLEENGLGTTHTVEELNTIWKLIVSEPYIVTINNYGDGMNLVYSIDGEATTYNLDCDANIVISVKDKLMLSYDYLSEQYWNNGTGYFRVAGGQGAGTIEVNGTLYSTNDIDLMNGYYIINITQNTTINATYYERY